MRPSKNQPYKRTDRVADLLRKILSEMFVHGLNHWGVDGLTVTFVDVSPDLRHAKVYYRVMDQGKLGSIKQNLQRVLPQIQREVGRQMQTKYTPRVSFEYDAAFDQGHHIADLLDQVDVDSSEEE
jgi:ribosome-binding factor A